MATYPRQIVEEAKQYVWDVNSLSWVKMTQAESGEAGGEVTVISSSLPTGASTSAKQDTLQTAVDAIKTAVELLDNAVSGAAFTVTGPLTDTQLRAVAVPVSGTFWQATQPVSFARLSFATDSVSTVPSASVQPAKEIRSTTGTQSTVDDSASNVTLLAANANRLGATVFNDSTVDLYLKLGATASVTSFTCKVAAAGYYEVPSHYVGIIDGIWASNAAGAARITELT